MKDAVESIWLVQWMIMSQYFTDNSHSTAISAGGGKEREIDKPNQLFVGEEVLFSLFNSI